MTFTKFAAAAVTAAVLAAPAVAAPEKYMLDSSHSQVVFQYNHLGFSTTWGMYSGFEGEIMFDAEDPAASSVSVTMPANSLITGWDERTAHFLGDDFFGAEANPTVTFTSTAIEVTGDTTGKITGDLTINGVTKSVVLDAVMNQMGDHPMAKKPWVGFNATGTVVRSEFDMGQFAPYVSDEVQLMISVEAMKAE
ncbi:MAG: YceI family protein [Paracoccaceae bacterium]